MSGEVSPNLSLPTQPTIDSAQAADTALQALAKWYEKSSADFVASEPELWIFDESLLRPSTRPVELAWRMEVTSANEIMPVRELVLVNAQRGSISLHFNQIDTAWHLTIRNNENNASSISNNVENAVLGSPLVNTYTANNGTSLPGSLLCNQTQPNCTSGSNPHADGAHKYAIGTYNLYATEHLRDSIDNAGMIIKSTVHYGSGYGNAYWDETQMVYGDAYGFPLADDVVAHELTHGVTQHESNLFPYYQSGAINESFSDLWGEYYDQTNGQGNDSPGVKWLMGENINGLGVIRSMSNPPAYGDPDKMSSAKYYEGDDDSGGVHTNSGVNNKAVFLMVDGGSFNGKAVTALGWEKTAAIYYEVNTNLLSSGADYSDLYYALQQACSDLIGQHGITSGNCKEVKDAADAVQMNAQPAPNFNTEAPMCTTAGTLPNIVFADDLESGTSNWTFNNGGTTRWQLDSPFGPFAQSGEHSLYADDLPQAVTDAKATLTSVVIPANAYLHFAHAYDFEHYVPNVDPNYYDGGVLEYSTNGGSTWLDAGSKIDYNGYKGTIYPNYINPLKGRSAFVGTSHGYISTRLNLSSLAGQSVRFRWRMGLDDIGFSWGWWVDNIKIYNCISNRTISGNAGAPGATLSYTDGTPKTVTSQANGSYSIQVPPGWSGTVTPTHGCYTFNPTSRTYNNVTNDSTNQNYSATPSSASLCASVNSLDFGDQLYYTKSDPVTISLTNFQGTNVHLGSFQRSSGQFILSSNTCAGATLTPAQTCTFDLQFKPTANGALSGTLTINSDAANDPVVISLDAVGLPGAQLVTKGGSFEQDNDNNGIPDFWNTTGLTSLDGISNQYAKHGTYSVKLVGQSAKTKTLKQTIVKNGSAGDDFLYVLWSRAQNVPGGIKYRTQVSFYNGNTLVERRIKDYTSGTHDWEYRWLPITVSGNYTRIEVEIIYSLASGTAWFDSDSLKWAP
jgi:Zn-dependent metalloprotease